MSHLQHNGDVLSESHTKNVLYNTSTSQEVLNATADVGELGLALLTRQGERFAVSCGRSHSNALERTVLLGKPVVMWLLNIFPPLYGTRNPLPCPQEPTNRPYSEADEPSARPHHLFV